MVTSTPPPSSSSSSSPSASPDDVARAAFTRELGGDTGDVAVMAAVERIGARMPGGLSRWFGPYGSTALVARALARLQADHPALTVVAATATPSPHLTGLGESAHAYGVRATAEGLIALLAALLTSLGGLIGEDLAMRLFTTGVFAPDGPGSGAAPAAAATTVAGVPAVDMTANLHQRGPGMPPPPLSTPIEL